MTTETEQAELTASMLTELAARMVACSQHVHGCDRCVDGKLPQFEALRKPCLNTGYLVDDQPILWIDPKNHNESCPDCAGKNWEMVDLSLGALMVMARDVLGIDCWTEIWDAELSGWTVMGSDGWTVMGSDEMESISGTGYAADPKDAFVAALADAVKA